MKAKRTGKKSEWREVDPKVVMGGHADIVLKNIYQFTTKTASQVAKELKMDLSLVQEGLDYLVKEGKIGRIDKTPYYNEPVYRIINKEMPGVDRKEVRQVVMGVVRRCLEKHGRLRDIEIEKETGLSMEYNGMAIGGLAYEGKIRMFQNTKTKDEAFCLVGHPEGRP